MRAMVCQLGVEVGCNWRPWEGTFLTSNGIMTDTTSKATENPECKSYLRTIEPSHK